MMTPQEVANCTFTKAMMGGYNMASVDDFLDKLTEDYSALYKENAALKAKLKMVADKLAEYREMEDAMRSALLTSQKMANSIVSEAEQKRDAVIAEAVSSVQARVDEVRRQLADEEQRLADVHAEVDRQLEAEAKRLAAGQVQLRTFIRRVSAVCNDQLTLLEQLPELPVEEPVQAQPAPAPEAAPAAEPAPVSEPEPAPQAEAPAVEEPVREEPEEDPFGEEASYEETPVAEEPQRETAPAAEPVEMSGDISKELEDVFNTPDAAEEAPEEDELASPFVEEDDEDDTAATRIMNLDDLQFGRSYMKD